MWRFRVWHLLVLVCLNHQRARCDIAKVHRTPSLPGEKLPNPAKIDEAMLDLLAGKIATHIKTVMEEVVAAGVEGEDGMYEL